MCVCVYIIQKVNNLTAFNDSFLDFVTNFLIWLKLTNNTSMITIATTMEALTATITVVEIELLSSTGNK